MKKKDYLKVSGVIFAVVAALHGLRVVFQWKVTVDGYPIPIGVSMIAAIVTLYLAFVASKLSK